MGQKLLEPSDSIMSGIVATVSAGLSTVRAPTNHRDLNVSEEGKDLYAAIDAAEKRLVRALVDTRQREQTTQRHPKKFSWQRITRVLRSVR
jgi:ribosome-associated translation inhibitor RaiA